MSKYYVKKDKLKRLERLFRADLRAIKKMGLGFDMNKPAVWNPHRREWVSEAETCGVCLVGSHVCARQVGSKMGSYGFESDLEAAARDLRVRRMWLVDLYTFYSDSDSPEDFYYPQAARLSQRLQAYAKEIGL